MARLPTPGSDNGTWGDVLNEFLSQSLKTDGTLQNNAVTANTLAPNSVTNAALATNAVTAAIIADGSISEVLLDSALQAKVNASLGSGVASVAGKTGIVTLDKADVGLGNVDNTSDTAKPVSTATQTALDGKANSSHTHTASQISDSTTIGRSVVTAADAATARTAIGAGTGSGDVVGPSSATTNNIVLMDGTTGKLIKDGGKGLPAGTVVGTSDIQVLTNKDLTSGNSFPTFNQSTTGSAAILATARTFQTDLGSTSAVSFNGSANITPGITGTLGVANGGTGRVSATTAYGLIAAGTTAAGAQQTIAPGSSGQFLKSAGASSLASFSSIQLSDISDTSSLVTLSGTQTLTDKTLTNPRINSIKDTSGSTILDYVTTPSAANQFYITNQSAGNYPTLGVDGSDANVGLTLAPKGNAPVRIFSSAGNTPTIDVAGPDTNISLNLVTKGAGRVRVNNAPVVTTWQRTPLYTDPTRYEVWPQIFNGGGVWTLTSGNMPLTFFTPDTAMTVSNIITMGWNDTTQTGATVCKVAIYRVDDVMSGGNKMTCVARSGHKANRWDGSVIDTAPIVDNGAASPGAISSVTLTAGQQYAVGFISIGHTGTPKVAALGSFRKNTLQPYMGFFGGGGHTDMPVYINSGWLEEWTFVWFALS